MRLNAVYAAFVLPASLISTVAAAPERPRGVGPEFAHLYAQSPDKFTCISNPHISLPLSGLNDDYCDCPDGSDEPGTSACSGLSPASPKLPSDLAQSDPNTTLALPGFYCENKGHNPSYVPFTAVNDGICDYEVCCDGTDEWAGVGGLKCENKCKEIGIEWRKQDAARQKSLTAAGKRRADMAAEAVRARKELENYLEISKNELKALEEKAANTEAQRDEVERVEKGKLVKKKSGAGGKAVILAGLARQRIETLREAIRTLNTQRDAYKTRNQELEAILAAFKEEYNPNFNDEGVKRAVRAWEEYAARDKTQDGSTVDAGREKDMSDIAATTGDDPTIPWADFEGGDDSGSAGVPELDLLFSFEAYLPAFLRDWLDGQLRSLRQTMIDNGILPGTADAASNDPGIDQNPAVKSAREQAINARNDVNNLINTRREKEEDLTKDYGQDDIFRALKGKCSSLDSGEYTYELCWLDKVTQKPKKGGMHNNMGNFVGFDRIAVDEDVGADGKGLGSGERLALKFENGAHCWQGPNRSTMVIVACAEEEEVWKVMEDAKCVYSMHVGSSAVCQSPVAPGEVRSQAGVKDEL